MNMINLSCHSLSPFYSFPWDDMVPRINSYEGKRSCDHVKVSPTEVHWSMRGARIMSKYIVLYGQSLRRLVLQIVSIRIFIPLPFLSRFLLLLTVFPFFDSLTPKLKSVSRWCWCQQRGLWSRSKRPCSVLIRYDVACFDTLITEILLHCDLALSICHVQFPELYTN